MDKQSKTKEYEIKTHDLQLKNTKGQIFSQMILFIEKLTSNVNSALYEYKEWGRRDLRDFAKEKRVKVLDKTQIKSPTERGSLKISLKYWTHIWDLIIHNSYMKWDSKVPKPEMTPSEKKGNIQRQVVLLKKTARMG